MKKLFEPESVAVIGASRDPNSVGYGVLKNLRDGGFFIAKYNQPFEGKVYAVNPNANEILGYKCYKSVEAIEGKVDLAVICVPSKIIIPIINGCVRKKVKAVIIISAGFAEKGEPGRILQDSVVKKLNKANITLLGPNCLGLINTGNKLNASFAPVMPPKGNVALITQSGALADSIIDWAVENSYGFSKIVSVGNSAQKDVSDFLEYLGRDNPTKVIAIYMEAVADGRKFMRAASKTKKPIVVIKAGKTEEGEKAIGSHTGSLAGSYEVYETALKQSGCIIAESVEEMFDVAKALAKQPKAKNDGVAIVTNGGGAGVLCADACQQLGIKLAKIKEKVWKRLDKRMHPAYSRSNPLDLVGDAVPARYEAAINELLKQKEVNGLVVIQTLQTMTDTVGNAKAVVNAHKKFPGKSVVCAFLGGKYTRQGVMYLETQGIPCYSDVNRAAAALRSLLK